MGHSTSPHTMQSRNSSLTLFPDPLIPRPPCDTMWGLAQTSYWHFWAFLTDEHQCGPPPLSCSPSAFSAPSGSAARAWRHSRRPSTCGPWTRESPLHSWSLHNGHTTSRGQSSRAWPMADHETIQPCGKRLRKKWRARWFFFDTLPPHRKVLRSLQCSRGRKRTKHRTATRFARKRLVRRLKTDTNHFLSVWTFGGQHADELQGWRLRSSRPQPSPPPPPPPPITSYPIRTRPPLPKHTISVLLTGSVGPYWTWRAPVYLTGRWAVLAELPPSISCPTRNRKQLKAVQPRSWGGAEHAELSELALAQHALDFTAFSRHSRLRSVVCW